jgi:hypothetical protein
MGVMRAIHKKIMAGQDSLIAMRGGPAKKRWRGAVNAFWSAQDPNEGFGNEIQGTRRDFRRKKPGQGMRALRRCWMMLN